MKDFWTKHFYMVLLILSCAGMSIAGLVMLPDSGESYGDQPALAATAINMIEQSREMPEDEEDMIDIAALKGDDESEAVAESSFNEQEFEEGMDRVEEAIRQYKENQERKKSGRERPEKTGRYPHTKKSEAQRDDDDRADDDDDIRWVRVDEDYFDDALFIGDSRQQGFEMYSGLENITVYADRGYQVYNINTKGVVDTPFGKITVTDALALNQHRFKKVYIQFGINEMTGGSSPDTMAKYYYNLIDYIKLMEPDAVIYLQGVIHVTKATSDSRPNLSNERINEKNESLKKIASDEGIIFLDQNEVFTNEDGALDDAATSDGIHLNSEYVQLQKDYLMKHAVYSDADRRREMGEFDDENSDDGMPYVELNTAQQQMKDQLDAYYTKLDEEEKAKQQTQEQTQEETGADTPENVTEEY